MDENREPERREKKGEKPPLLDARTKKQVIVVAFGVVLFVALGNLGSIAGVLSFVLSVIKPFIIGAVIAFLLNLPMRFIERRLLSKFKRRRALSILLTYVLTLAVIVLLLVAIIPQLFNSIMALYGNIPGYLENLNGLASLLVSDFGVAQSTIDTIYNTVTDFLSTSGTWMRESFPSILVDMATAVGSGFMTGFIGLIASVYMLANKEKLQAQCKRILYAFAPEKVTGKVIRVAHLCSDIFSSFISGKLLVSLILGVACFIFMLVVNMIHNLTGIGWLQMPYALLISTLVGLTNIIPYFGPVLGAVLAFLILFMVSPISALLFLAFLIILQQVDNNFITPKLISKSVGLPAIWVFIGTIVGGKLLGITGMLIGVPVAAVLYILGSDLIEKRLKKKGLDTIVPRVIPNTKKPPQREYKDNATKERKKA